MTIVISSRENAPRHGPGWLLVDGTDRVLCRTAEFAFRPTVRQTASLNGLLAVCCEVYNAGLQERREAWRQSRTRIRLFDQFNQIRHLRGVRDDTLAWGTRPLRGALRRLDEAYAAFFRRCANGQTPGHPRFRSRSRFDTVCWDEPRSWSVKLDEGQLHVQGVGHIRLSKGALRQLRRLAGRGGVPTTLTVTRRRAGTGWAWRACVGLTNVAATHTTPTAGPGSVVGADRGVAVTLALSDGQLLSMPGFVTEARDEIAELMRQRDGKTKGSRAWKQLNRRVAKGYMRARHRSDNWARQTARDLVDTHGVVVLEDLKLANMTRSARGTVDNPGRNVAAKQALNRQLQDAALGRLRHWVCAKAEEAGRRTWAVNPANTSRTCAACGHCAIANRVTRDRFRCQQCGHAAHADTNAAENIAARGRVCETTWDAAGAPPLVRPTPRLQRHKVTAGPGLARAG